VEVRATLLCAIAIRLTRNVRRPVAAIVALLGVLLSSSIVLADDYRVDFGIKAKAGEDVGTMNCQFGKTCFAKIESLGLSLNLHLSRVFLPDRASAYLYNRDMSCCYFMGSTDTIDIDPRQPLSRVPFFNGWRARGRVFVENERISTLYLRFNIFRDHL